MKRLIGFVLFMVCLILTSCNPVSDVPPRTDLDSSIGDSFTFNPTEMKTILTSLADINRPWAYKSKSPYDLQNQTLLVYYDSEDNLAPLVFSNKDGEYIVFSVADSYPVDEKLFAIKFNYFYISGTKPEFLMHTRYDSYAQKDITLPVLDCMYKPRKYHAEGQLLVNANSGRAVFLTPLDFSKFQLNHNGDYYLEDNGNDYFRISNKYKLDTAYSHNDFLYFPTCIWFSNSHIEKGLERISIDNPSYAEPMINTNAFSVENILGCGSNYMIVENDSYEKYLIDLGKGCPPVKLKEKTMSVIKEDPLGFNINIGTIGTFGKDEVIIGDDFWKINVPRNIDLFLYSSNGEKIKKYDWTKGFYFGDVWVDENINSDGSFLYLNKYVYPNFDENGYYYDFVKNKVPIATVQGDIVYDFKKTMIIKGVTLGELVFIPEEVSDSYFKAFGQIFNYYINKSTGDLYSGKNYKYIRTAEGLKIKSLSSVPVPFSLGDIIITSVNIDDSCVYDKDARCYKVYADNEGFLFAENDEEIMVYDIKGNKLTDELYEASLDGFCIDNKIYPSSLMNYKNRTVRLNGMTYNIICDTDGCCFIEVDVAQYRSDLNKSKIRSANSIISDGVYYANGTPIDVESVNENSIRINGSEHYIQIDDDGNYYIFLQGYAQGVNRIAATRIDVDDKLNISAGSSYSADIDLLIDPFSQDSILIDVVQSEDPRIFNLYYWVRNKTDGYKYLIVLQLDVRENGSLNVINKIKLPHYCSIPDYRYQSIKEKFSKENRPYVLCDNGQTMYWISYSSLYKIDLNSGVLDWRMFEGDFADSVLTRVGDNLIVSVYSTATDIITYSLDRHNINADPIIIASNDMALIPLVNLDISSI